MAEEEIRMDDDEQSPKDDAREFEIKIKSAVSKIEADSDLRFFFITYLSRVGLLPQVSVFHESPTHHARNTGMIDSGLLLIEMLNFGQPLLWPTLQIEGLKDET